MKYEFRGCTNQACPDKDGNPKAQNIYVISYPMKDAPDLGTQIKCPMCRKGKITRILSTGAGSNFIIKGKPTPDSAGNSFMTRIEGQDTKITFIDHEHTRDDYENQTVAAARKAGINGAYYDPAYGKACVQVASSMPDPLGKMARSENRPKKTQRTAVNQAVRSSSKNNGSRRPINGPGGMKAAIPIRR